MKDKLGQPLKTGDFVVTHHPKYKEMMIGKVTGFTNQNVRIEVEWERKTKKHIRTPASMIVIDGELAMMYFLTNPVAPRR